MAVEALELQRDVEGALDHRIGVALGLQLRLAFDGLGERDRRGRVLRHELAELVDLPVGHLQHAADVAQHAARLQGAEGDDLRHLVAAVALLHVADHLVAAVLAEVDVEVGHRHALGIEEALEQQVEAERIEIGDGERIGDQRARARAAAGTDRNALLLRPLDEVGHDQEVARIFHPFDDADLEGEPLAVFLFGAPGRHAMRGDPLLQPVLGALARAPRTRPSSDGEARQDRFARRRPVSAAPGDLDGRGERLGQVGEQRGHLGAALEVVLGGELPPVGLGHHAAFGDGDQRVVGVIVLALGEIGLVGGDQRNALGVGELEQHRLGVALVGRAVALQFEVEPVAEQLVQGCAAALSKLDLPCRDRGVERPARPAGERDQPAGQAVEPGELQVRLLARLGFHEGPRVELHQVAVALLARGEQHDARERPRATGEPRIARLVAEIHGHRAADDRLDAVARELLGELQRPEHVVGVGQRQRWLLVGFGEFRELADRQARLPAANRRNGRADARSRGRSPRRSL